MTLPLAGTMSGWALAGGAAGTLLSGAGIGLLLRRRRDRRVGSPEEVAAAAEAALSGFIVSGAVVGADGQGALAVATDGRVAAIKRQGRMLAVREIPWTRVRSTAEGIIAEVEGRFGSVTLAGVDVLDIRRLKA
ncbi:hypothetical protein SPKIRA_26950 [Sphingomonas paucimobilis]|uniref:DNA, contig: SP642 n=2 Tax=Sphingomonas paucimobilis TaxID=13689 RepID=A0A0C9MUU2_SPHPI|nr:MULTISPECIES: LPXTG cell wall anchor domain-containing protein [Sphingomonas]MCM3680127.1 LPXTG cell wall anchor domain-containing protein [Sphingomonas paucimobilis]MDG5970317.1 LPXTG cell wall anchor domain-containing protein [Sphingomonas paucimobilis]QBE93115.1 LPXTG cell wall anchor domain-containing protein [Sphingomonas paucimobilis]RSU65862.1 hypothetical protein BRX36_09010 [Sphingomonas sp. S-NIH.Pt1_0416]SUJ34153.1 Uncharacterised protein [Sphingomonas paucimobilis]